MGCPRVQWGGGGTPILDIGVGGGRTAPLLVQISTDYIGIDYTPELVEVAASRYPQLRFQCLDARDLSAFADQSFGLVNFSCNAIDSVDYADRDRILQEVLRVLRPGGLFLFSAHNKAGPGFREDWRTLLPQFSPNPLKLAWRTAKKLVALPAAAYNHLRFHHLRHEDGEHGVSNAAAHHFGLVLLYLTLAEQLRELARAGFRTEIVFDSQQGRPVSPDDDLHNIWWFHYIVRKSATPVAAAH